jgi:hypothetical protein
METTDRLTFERATEITEKLIEAGLDVMLDTSTPRSWLSTEGKVSDVRQPTGEPEHRIKIDVNSIGMAGQLHRIAELAERDELACVGISGYLVILWMPDA